MTPLVVTLKKYNKHTIYTKPEYTLLGLTFLDSAGIKIIMLGSPHEAYLLKNISYLPVRYIIAIIDVEKTNKCKKL